MFFIVSFNRQCESTHTKVDISEQNFESVKI